MRVKRNPFLYGTNPSANSRRIGDRIQWSVQVIKINYLDLSATQAMDTINEIFDFLLNPL